MWPLSGTQHKSCAPCDSPSRCPSFVGRSSGLEVGCLMLRKMAGKIPTLKLPSGAEMPVVGLGTWKVLHLSADMVGHGLTFARFFNFVYYRPPCWCRFTPPSPRQGCCSFSCPQTGLGDTVLLCANSGVQARKSPPPNDQHPTLWPIPPQPIPPLPGQGGKSFLLFLSFSSLLSFSSYIFLSFFSSRDSTGILHPQMP